MAFKTLKLIAAAMSLAIVSTIALANKESKGVIYDIRITRVIDGDTVGISASWLPDPLKKELSIRVYGVDTPEKGHRAKCPAEAERGQKATEFTKAFISQTTSHKMLLMGWDKYGGRVLGDVILDGKSLRNELIARGFAREYYGEAKTSWC